jgi:cobalt-zinc-cadmium efflux system membrane fusion protein
MMKTLNHAGLALFVFGAVTGTFLWFTGSLHIGLKVPVDGEQVHAAEHEGHGAEEHAHENQAHKAEGRAPACCPPNENAHDHQDHAHGEDIVADLDDLVNLRCEHDTAAVDCDNCRFEVGVVKLDPSVAEVLVRSEPVMKAKAARTLRVTGQVEVDATRVVDVPSTGSGWVTEVHALLGETVEAGDVMAVVYSGDLGEARAAYAELRAQLEVTRRTLERERDLREKQISSEADYLDARKEFEAAQARVEAASQRLRIVGQEVEVGKALGNGGTGLAQLEIKAPRRGIVTAQSVSAGKFVETSQSLYTLADLSNLWVWCDVYERDIAAVHAALSAGRVFEAAVHVAAFPETEFRGTVDLIGSAMDLHTRTIPVRVQVENTGMMLRPGMFAQVEIGIDSDQVILAVPQDAVVSDEGVSFVFQHWKDDLWARRDVETGRAQGDAVEILAGLPENARVITQGAFMLKSDVLRAKMGAGCAD